MPVESTAALQRVGFRTASRRWENGFVGVHYEAAIKKAWDSEEFKEFMSRRGFDMIYLDAAKFGES